jgi:hypothetical protein
MAAARLWHPERRPILKPERKEAAMRLATVILLSLATVVVACGGGGGGAKGTATPAITTGRAELQKHEADLRAAAKESIQAFIAGDSDAFYASFSSDFQARCPKKDFDKIIALASVFLGDLSKRNATIDVTDVSFQEDRATAKVKVDLGDGASMGDSEGELSDFWVLEDGTWKADTEEAKPCDLGNGVFGDMTPTADETPATGPGASRASAVALGESVVTRDLQVTVLEADLDATARLAARDSTTETAAPGNRYVLIRVRAENVGSGEGTVSVSSLDFKLTGSRNVLYDGFDDKTSCGYIDDEIRGELFAGGTTEGYVCFQAPSDETGLILAVSPSLSFGDNDRRYLALE